MRSSREVLVFVFRARGLLAEVLLVHRCRELGGYWHSVAGGVEGDETDEEAVLRELREETGLDGTGSLAARRHRYIYPLAEETPRRRALYEPETEHVSVACFRVDAPTAWEPRLDWEHDEYRWCSPDEALALLRWPAVREALLTFLGDSTRAHRAR